MQQGTGKTRVAIELIESTDCEDVLFVCPFSTKNNLDNELKKWGLSLPYRIVGYESLSMSDNLYLELLDTVNASTFLVADESIFIKNDKSKRYQRMLKLASLTEYRLILNGTPLTKDEWDIYNQMEFLSPRILNMSRDEFLNIFFKKIKYKKRGQSPREFYKLSEVNIDYLHKLIEPYVFKSDLNIDVDERTKHISLPGSTNTTLEYESLKQLLLSALSRGECKVEHFTNLANCVFSDPERHKRIAKQLNGQMIVFCTLLAEVHNIANEIGCYVVTGSTPESERQRIFEAFKHDNKPLLMTYGVGAFGLNLQFCNRMAFASLTYDYAKIDQAKSRIKRLGQIKDIEYTVFESDLGIFNLIKENIDRKTTLEKLIIEKIKEDNIEEIL